FLRSHCRERQQQIEETLLFRAKSNSRRAAWQNVSPPPPAEAVAGLRSRFEAELAHGEGYQRAYQEYEAGKIAAGAAITAPDFFDEFHAGRAPIASPLGSEEWFARVTQDSIHEYFVLRMCSWGVVGAGLAAMGMALLLRYRRQRGA